MVKVRMKMAAMGCLLSLVLIDSPIARAQENRVLNSDDYPKILDRLFPRDVLDKSGRRFMLVLRYTPSFEAESQIVISGREDGINVIEYYSMDGNVNLKLEEVMAQTGQASSVDLAKHIRVKKREMKLPLYLLNLWRRNLIHSLSRALRPKAQESTLQPATTMSITDDGTRYELWDSSMSGEVYFNASGSEERGYDFSGKRALIKWMELIRKEVGKRK
jgi:hypothetical protein